MIFDSIDSFVAHHKLIENKPSILLGLSGGPDSIFLLHYLNYLRKKGNINRLIAAHLDHQWRENSASDVLFCKTACENLGIEFVSAQISQLEFPQQPQGSKEEIGRYARRFFMQKIRQQENLDLIAVAHHLQDQEETFFIRLLRGTSLTGLISMRPKHNTFIRPLLETSKSDILAYLDEHSIPYLTDPTNVHFDYLRNRIRATVLPAMLAADERFDHNFLITLNRLRSTEEFLEELTQKYFESISIRQDHMVMLDVIKLFAMHPVMQYRILMQWLISAQVPFAPSQAFLNELLRFLNQEGSKEHALHEHWKIIKKKNIAYIENR